MKDVREHQAQLDFKSEMDAMTERLKTKYKTDTTFSQARLSQMREDYEKQLKELRQRLKTETEAAEQREQAVDRRGARLARAGAGPAEGAARREPRGALEGD